MPRTHRNGYLHVSPPRSCSKGYYKLMLFAGRGIHTYTRVNASTYCTTGKKGVLRKKLRGARNYEVCITCVPLLLLTLAQEWKAAARDLDEYMGFNKWRTIDEDTFYDWKLIRKVQRSLKTLRESNDIRGLLGVLETCIRNNFAGVESSR